MQGRKKNKEKISKSTKHLWIGVSLCVIFSIIYVIVMLITKEKANTDDNILKGIKNTLNESEKSDGYDSINDFDNPEAAADFTEETDTADTAGIKDGDEAGIIFEKIEETAESPVKARRIYQDKFDFLRGKYNNNEDIIGIVKIPGTVIYYPVAHHDQEQNNNYYLNRNLYKQPSSAGCIFMDYENSVERHDPNTILYGHQMSSNSMFHTLNYFRDVNFFNNHRYIIFNTIYENNVWEVFAFLKAHTSFDYIQVYFGSEKEFLDRAAEIKERSMHETDIDVREGDRILVLSTCTNQDPDTRYVLAARRIKNKDDIPAEILQEMNNAIDNFK